VFRSTRKAFTLIELLIVVAIIGILAAIAVPNFLNARVRSMVARTYADMKAVTHGFELYHLDHGDWVPDYDGIGMGIGNSEVRTYRALTTPVVYLSSIPLDVWISKEEFVRNFNKSEKYYEYYGYNSGDAARLETCKKYGIGYVIRSLGPDRKAQWGGDFLNIGLRNQYYAYDQTNGLNSSGDIIATNRGVPE